MPLTGPSVAGAELSVKTLPAILSLLLASSPGLAASFDCARATTDIEKILCASPQLAHLTTHLPEQGDQNANRSGTLCVSYVERVGV